MNIETHAFRVSLHRKKTVAEYHLANVRDVLRSDQWSRVRPRQPWYSQYINHPRKVFRDGAGKKYILEKKISIGKRHEKESEEAKSKRKPGFVGVTIGGSGEF